MIKGSWVPINFWEQGQIKKKIYIQGQNLTYDYDGAQTQWTQHPKTKGLMSNNHHCAVGEKATVDQPGTRWIQSTMS